MVPEWHDIHNLPYERMLEPDKTWFYRAATGNTFRAHVYYKERVKGFERIEFLPLKD